MNQRFPTVCPEFWFALVAIIRATKCHDFIFGLKNLARMSNGFWAASGVSANKIKSSAQRR